MKKQQNRTEQEWIARLNAPTMEARLEALRALIPHGSEAGRHRFERHGTDVNNHIHSTYSFSPYSPTKAVWMAAQAGLVTAGLMDHDSLSGAREFIEAGRIMGIATTVGAECRASFAGTPLVTRRINNPDQTGVGYVALHGVPHSQIQAVIDFFKPIQSARKIRNLTMTDRLNGLLKSAGIELDYVRDVEAISEWKNGGEVTERHLLYAVAQQLIQRLGVGAPLVEFLRRTLQIPVSEKAEQYLMDPENPFVAYDLLGVLKSDLVEKFYIPATEECPPIQKLAEFAHAHQIILAYAYLGDVGQSVTGDKKTQAFEDSYLDELFPLLKDLGFHALTYMPSRNTREQLTRIRSLCERYELFQISGEDINQPRQKFICEAQRDPFFAHLQKSAWALVGHEIMASRSLQLGMFHPDVLGVLPGLTSRIESYCGYGAAFWDKPKGSIHV